jgi:hypothetical protein
MIFTRGAICSPRVLQSTEGKNHSLPRSIYYFLHDSPILIEKSRKFVEAKVKTKHDITWFAQKTNLDQLNPAYVYDSGGIKIFLLFTL